MCTKVASAIAAGTSFVLKPSEITPGAAQILSEIIDTTSLPKGVFNLIHGYGHTVGKLMSSHSGLEMISFTGSTRAGIDIQKNAADNVKRVSLELGGKSPNIILDDVDLEQAVNMGMKQCFFNTGQSCSAPTRMLVPQNLMEQATEIAVAAASEMITGDPKEEDTFLGPISNEKQFKKVQELIQIGIDEGAELSCGGVGRPDGMKKGFYVKPTVFSNVVNSMQIAKEEIFGPVICLIGYSNIEEAIDIANDTPYGLSSMISCGDLNKGQQIAKRIRSGQVILNRISRGDYPAPFGGFKMSGNGREHGLFGIDEYLEVQAVIT
jgi:aldehyde dehydrogenase (NAD+)